MTNPITRRRALAEITGLALAATGAAFAQTSTGNLYGTVIDTEGNRLPGVTLTLTGIGRPQIQVSRADGDFRFLALDPGTYKLEANLDGFSPVVYEGANIRIGRNTTLQITMNAAVEETITVTTESPLIDERKISSGTVTPPQQEPSDPPKP